MPQVEINLPVQSHTSYEASALHPSNHGWVDIKATLRFAFTNNKYQAIKFVLFHSNDFTLNKICVVLSIYLQKESFSNYSTTEIFQKYILVFALSVVCQMFF